MILTYIVYVLIYLIIGIGGTLAIPDSKINDLILIKSILLVLLWPVFLLLLISSNIFKFFIDNMD